MNTFVIKETNTDGYDRFLLWLSFESLIDHLSSIEEAPNMVNSSGRILIDQLFITGDGDNRFMCCDFQNGKLDFKTAHIVSPVESFRKETVQWICRTFYFDRKPTTNGQRRYCLLRVK